MRQAKPVPVLIVKWQLNLTGVFRKCLSCKFNQIHHKSVFLSIDTDTVSVKLQGAFSLPNGVDVEIIELQIDIEMQTKAKDCNRW